MNRLGERTEPAHRPNAPGGLRLVGLGSPHGDDQLGWLVVDRLRPELPESVSSHKISAGLDLLTLLDGTERLLIVDASSPSGQPGTVRAFDWPFPELAAMVPLGSHDVGLLEAIRLAETLGLWPDRARLFAVEADQFEPGQVLSPAVRAGLDTVVSLIRREIAPFESQPAPQ